MKHFDVPRLYVGPPGVGKTAHIHAKYGHVVVMLLSAASEEDIAGLPWRDGDDERRTKPAVFKDLEEAAAKGGSVCLFLDEMDKARREVADTLLTLITARKVGQWSLPEGCHIAAAANPPEWGGGDGISQAMQSRFAVIRYTPSPTQWAAWLTATYPGPLAEGVARGVMHGEVPLFEHAGDGYDMRITCPRTWDLALRVIAAGESDVDEVVSGLLTSNAAAFLLALKAKATGSAVTPERKMQDVARGVAVASRQKRLNQAPVKVTL